MLRTIRKYQKSVLGFVAIGLVAVSMGGFGMNSLTSRKTPYAIKVGDTEIPYTQISSERRAVEDRYQQILGQAYTQLYKTLRQEIPQQVVDQIVDREVLEQASKNAGLYAGDDQLKAYVSQKIFPNGFNAEQYGEFLRRQGMDASQFEDTLRKSLAQEQLTGLLSLASVPSEYEAKAVLQHEEQRYDIQYVAIPVSSVIASIPEPTDDAVKTFYEANTDQFETPIQVAYEYAEFKPENFESRVEVQPEDVEVEYTENLKAYMSPLEINARHIQINVAKDASDDVRKKAKDTATDVLSKLKSGEDFAVLARQFSNDTSTGLLGGSLGWIKRGKMNPAFDKAAFDLKAGEFSDVVEAPYGYHIIQVTERHDPKQREIAEVKSDIEQLIRKREAPALASSLAQSYADEFKKSNVTLAEFFKQKNLENVVKSVPLSSETENPSGIAGLNKAVLSLNGDSGVVDLKNSVLVHITDRKDASIKSISEVRPQIVTVLKNKAGLQALQQKSGDLSAKITDGSIKTIADLGKAAGVDVVSSPKIKLREQTAGFLADKKVKDAITGAVNTPQLVSNSFFVDGANYFIQVNAIEIPDDKDIAPKIGEQKDRISQQLAQVLNKELTEKLKSEIDFEVKDEALR